MENIVAEIATSAIKSRKKARKMMSKYIDADELIFALNETIEKHKNSDMFTRTIRAAENMITIIKRMHSADVVEVVRCKDCIDFWCCDWSTDNGFCDRGKRRTEDEKKA